MTHLPEGVFTHILSYCNDPLTLYKNKHREQWRRIRVQRVRHWMWELNPDYDSDEDDEDEEVWIGDEADVMTPYVDNTPYNSAKVAFELNFTDEFDWFHNNEDWPTVYYDTVEDDENWWRYKYTVDYKGECPYEEWHQTQMEEYRKWREWMMFVDEDPMFFVRVLLSQT